MPDKDNENKFMAMLERMGMVRKIDTDDDAEPDSGEFDSFQSSSRTRDDDFTQADDDYSDIAFKTPHQPIPGMPDPVLPSEKPRSTEPERFVEPERFMEPEPFIGEEPYAEPEPYMAPETQTDPRAGSSPGYRYDQAFWDESPESKSLPIEAYTDRYLDMDELYNIFSMKTSGTDTVYLVEEYLKSLPDSLPDDSRRDIIIKIIAASGFSYDTLMGDGVTRVGKLKEYAEQFAQRTEEYVATRNAELDTLERQIQKIRGMIERRRDLHKKQFFAIEAEAQRLKDILAFLSD